MKWINVKDALPEKWERVAVLEFNGDEPKISHVTGRNYFDAQGNTFSKTIWDGMERAIQFWVKLPPFPKKWVE